MISKKEKIIEKIDMIDNLLIDDECLDDFIEKIDNKKLDIPQDLTQKINLKLKNYDIKNKEHHLKTYDKTFSILKIVACTIFAIIIWYSMPQDIDFSKNTEELAVNTKGIDQILYDKINLFGQKVNNFFMVPIDLEGGNL